MDEQGWFTRLCDWAHAQRGRRWEIRAISQTEQIPPLADMTECWLKDGEVEVLAKGMSPADAVEEAFIELEKELIDGSDLHS